MQRTSGTTSERRETPRPQSRSRRITTLLTRASLGAYLLLLFFPQIVFAHGLSYRHFRVYSVAPLDPNIRLVLDRADQRLAACEINDPRAVHRIFLCPSHAAFAFFAPAVHTAFADNLPFVHNIFVNTADVARDAVTSGSAAYNRRTLSGVIAHECTHTLLADRFGQLAMLRRPSWKQEGYCDRVAGSTSFDPAQGRLLLAQRRTDPSPSFFYFRAFTAVCYLSDRCHWSAARIMDTPLSLESVLQAAAPPHRENAPPARPEPAPERVQ